MMWSSPRIAAAGGALAGVALLTPPRAALELLVGGPVVDERLVAGGWLWKVTLLGVGALLLAMGRIELSGGRTAPLLSRPPAASPGPPRPVDTALFVALLSAALVLRLVALGEGLWFDEIQTFVEYVSLPGGRILTTFDTQNQHMLYTLAAKATTSLFAPAAWALRLPAALFGVASIAALYWFGTLVTTRREAVLAAAALTFSYHHVWFSQNARGYTGLLFWSLIASGLFIRMLEAGRFRSWRLPIAYGLAMAAAAFTHVTALFVAAAHALIWVWGAARQRRRTRALASTRDPDAIRQPAGLSPIWMPAAGFVLAGAFTLLSYSLVLPQFVATLLTPSMEGVGIEWKNPVWLLREMVGGLSQGLPGGPVTLAAATLIGLAGVASYLRHSVLTGAVLVLPVVVTAVAILALGHNLWPRFFFFAAGFAALIGIRGLFAVARRVIPRRANTAAARKRSDALATIVAVLVIVASATTVRRAWSPKQDFRAAGEFVDRNRGRDDVVLTVDMTSLPYRDYLGRLWPEVTSVSELEQQEAGAARTWVVYTFPNRLAIVQPAVWERLERDYAEAARFEGTVRGGAVVVLVR